MHHFFALILLTWLNLFHPGNDPIAHRGIMDLREIADPEHFIVRLNGEWEFYWNEMLHPHDFSTGLNRQPFYGKVPSYWSGYKIPGIRKKGYATYRLKVLLPPGYRN